MFDELYSKIYTFVTTINTTRFKKREGTKFNKKITNITVLLSTIIIVDFDINKFFR